MSYNTTTVGIEQTAGALNSLPLIVDELQIKQNSSNSHDNIVYMLSEGRERVRGAKSGGVRSKVSWANTVISNGENPLTTQVSDSGVYNRIIEIDASAAKLFPGESGAEIADKLKTNYGVAGKIFVDALLDNDYAKVAVARQKALYSELLASEKTSKQSLSASLLIAASEIAAKLFFKGDFALAADEIVPFLHGDESIDSSSRTYEWLMGWIAQNSNKFTETAQEIYGKETDTETQIIAKVLKKEMEREGFNSYRSFLAWLAENGKIRMGKDSEENRATLATRINGHVARCICLSKDEYQLSIDGIEEETPF
jgi:uncharacterized protein (DUF927 family)